MADAVMRPTLFLLHSLGASARAWDGVAAKLGGDFDCVALDLPGFGARSADGRTDVAAMLDWLASEVQARDPENWMPVGHSMGGKLATLLAARAEAGEPGLSAMAGVVLLAASPPGPEPMDEERRAEMIRWFADGPPSEPDARRFVDANVAGRLPGPAMEQAVADVLRSGPHAWRAWLERGSREDWRAHVGRIAAPALVVAGAEDGDLGAENQRRLNVPLFRDARFEVIANAAHMLPYEAPAEVAALIASHWRERVRDRALPGRFARLLASERVSARTRRALLGRMDDPDHGEAGCLSEAQVTTLRAVLERVLPGRRDGADLARRMDVALASGQGDGWRFAELPPDAEAWRRGLDTLDALAGGFAGLPPDAQDAVLAGLEDADDASTPDGSALSAAQMRLWFEDLRAEAVRTWLSHPKALNRIGYDGFATGGDGPFFPGYAATAADELEPWQLRSAGERA